MHYAPQIGLLVPSGAIRGNLRTRFKIGIVVSSQTCSLWGPWQQCFLSANGRKPWIKKNEVEFFNCGT